MADKLLGGLAIWVCIAVFGLLITAACWPSGGRETNNHFGPLPAYVTQLAPRYFLVDRSASTTPAEICQNTDGGTNPVDVVAVVPRIQNALFIACDAQQTWNDHRLLGINFGHQLTHRVVESPGVDGALVLTLLVCLAPGLWDGLIDRREHRRKRRLVKAGVDDRRDVLAQSYARGKITGTELEQGLDRINEELL